MRKPLVALLLPMISLIFLTAFSELAGSAIYGPHDLRLDIKEVPQYRPLAKAIAIAVGNNLLTQNANGTYAIQMVTSLADSSEFYVCPDEKFASQPSLGICTGFLVGDRYLVTAGHCALPEGKIDNANKPFCTDFSWYFNYNLNSTGKVETKQIPNDQIYHCKNIIRAENIQLPAPAGQSSTNPGNDFALLELDRPVINAKPLSLATQRPGIGDGVFTIGHPSGLPAKFSGLRYVISNPKQYYYTVNLDTLGIDSGSPVFNSENQVTGILVSGHPVDYYEDPKGCYRVNHCDASGLHCNLDSSNSYLPLSNFVQQIYTVKKYLPLPRLGQK